MPVAEVQAQGGEVSEGATRTSMLRFGAAGTQRESREQGMGVEALSQRHRSCALGRYTL